MSHPGSMYDEAPNDGYDGPPTDECAECGNLFHGGSLCDLCPECAEAPNEPDNDPICVCGVYRSEHQLCGCGEWENAAQYKTHADYLNRYSDDDAPSCQECGSYLPAHELTQDLCRRCREYQAQDDAERHDENRVYGDGALR